MARGLKGRIGGAKVGRKVARVPTGGTRRASRLNVSRLGQAPNTSGKSGGNANASRGGGQGGK